MFPLNSTLRHFPIRSQRHGDLKVFRDRKPRYNVEEMDRGWHYHYARLRKGHRFIHDPDDLIEWRPARFDQDYLLPRLTQVGIDLPAPRHGRLKEATVSRLRATGLLPTYVRLRNRALKVVR